jgi:hypothetical protein
VTDAPPSVGGTLVCDACTLAGLAGTAGSIVRLENSTVRGSVAVMDTDLGTEDVRIVGGLSLIGGEGLLTSTSIRAPEGRRSGIAVGDGTRLTIAQVFVGGTSGPGLRVLGLGGGTSVVGAQLTLFEVGDGIVVDGDLELDLTQVAVQNATANGVNVGAGEGPVSLSQLHLSNVRGPSGVVVRGRGMTLQDVAVGTRGDAAIRAAENAHLEVRNLLVNGAGLGILAAGASLDLADVRLVGLDEVALLVGEEGAVLASRLAIESSGNDDDGPQILIAGPAGDVSITDSGVYYHSGPAVMVVGDGDVHVELARIWVDGAEVGGGIAATRPEGSEAAVSLELDGLRLHNLAGRAVGADGALVGGRSIIVRQVRGSGLEVRNGADVGLEEVVVVGSTVGASVADATLALDRSRLAESTSFGVSSNGRLSLHDVTLEENAEAGAWLWGGVTELVRVRFTENGVGLVYDGDAAVLEPAPIVHHEAQPADEHDCSDHGDCP